MRSNVPMTPAPEPPAPNRPAAPMSSAELREVQRPLKAGYAAASDTAVITLHATGTLGEGVTCSVETGRQLVQAGLHPSTGGSGMSACSGDLLLQALVACAGVTLQAVATSLDFPVVGGTVTVEGDFDVRGTLGVDRAVAVGFSRIRLHFAVDGDLTDEQQQTLLRLTERYCVVLQTLTSSPQLSASLQVS